MNKFTLLLLLLIGLNGAGRLTAQVLDSTFGYHFLNYLTFTYFGQRADYLADALFLPDGKFLLAGTSLALDRSAALAMVRLRPNGQYDLSFGQWGHLLLPLGRFADSCLVAVLQGADRVLMGGFTRETPQSREKLLLVRTHIQGQLDTTFGTRGQVIIDLPGETEWISEIVVLPDAKILIGGTMAYGIKWSPNWLVADSSRIFVGRLLPNGQVDSTFGQGGFFYASLSQACTVSSLGDMLVDPKGRIWIGGYPGLFFAQCVEGEYTTRILRYLPNGQPDASFGTHGTRVIFSRSGVSTRYYQAAVQLFHLDSDGRLLVIGQEELDKLLMARLWAEDGRLDSSFANRGIYFARTRPLSRIPDWKSIIRIGNHYYLSSESSNGGHGAYVARFRLEGVLDSAFGGPFLWPYFMYVLFQVENEGGFGSLSVKIHPTSDSSGFYLYGTKFSSVHYLNDMFIGKVRLTDASVSAGEVISHAGLLLYPNPAPSGGRVFFSAEGQPAPAEPLLLQLTDMQGRLLHRQSYALAEGINEISLPPLPPGAYVFSLTGAQGRWVQKLLVR
ncbi:MAG: T9SS type A sorting domain-containing protein [Saprospiraceae bacterium]|nr:T9SS type A sorting domain-containing protein [Saprospiraceae bacterium]MDW8229923.1 T9SS type A sorting domain-containing protein [Saprospiraceae bacterium]